MTQTLEIGCLEFVIEDGEIRIYDNCEGVHHNIYEHDIQKLKEFINQL